MIKKTFIPEKDWINKNLWLEFEGAMHLADVWINGKHLAQHAGGYTPFVIDLSTHINYDKENEILVRLDNRDNPLIPPGKPLYKLDFCYYGGIYRNVNMIIKPKDIYITHPIMANEVSGGGIFITYPEVSKEKATIRIQTHLKNASQTNKTITLRHRLFEINRLFTNLTQGKEIKKSEKNITLNQGQSIHQNQILSLDHPRLWHPDSPHLYIVQTEVIENGKVVDTQENRMGIRHLEFSKEKGFIINGMPLRLIGSNRHMEYPYVGNALPDNAHYRDIYQIKESGFNIVRLGHYPQTVSVLDACDELGLLAIEPIPGWQFFNKDSLFIELTYRDVRDMIRRDRNHPSVILWETTLNESWPPDTWKDGAVQAAHEEYPGNQCFTSGDGYGYDGFDVVYNDWAEGFHRPNPGTKAGFIREYYDFEFGGHYSTTRITRGDGMNALLQNAWNAQWSHNRYRKQYPWTAGDAVWSMYDYNRGCADNICYSGVADIFRLPKFSLNFFKNQIEIGKPLPEGPMKPSVFIADYWIKSENETRDILIYGNVDEVELKVNGQTVAKQYPDKGPDTDYVSKADGGNCSNLNYPPFTFRNVPWQEGAIEAIGYLNGEKVVSEKKQTPQKPSQLQISYFQAGKPAGKNDLLILYVKISDKNGSLCVESKDTVELHVNPPHKIIGPSIREAEAGIASFLIQTDKHQELLIVADSKIQKKTESYLLK
ncbi:MAG: glycoside hydrolase family 2 protein [Bacteroidales bacterium]|nr:glycoside hydrolase family 2 protein [Bacteroidales bacterium]